MCFALRPGKLTNGSYGEVTAADSFIHPDRCGFTLEHVEELLAGTNALITRHRDEEVVLNGDRRLSRDKRSDAA
jgi:hypothetical protein